MASAYKPLEYSSADDDEAAKRENDGRGKLHYDKRNVPKLESRRIKSKGPSPATGDNLFTPLRSIRQGRFSQIIVVKEAKGNLSNRVLCMKLLMRKKEESLLGYENELNTYRHADSHPALFPHILPLVDYFRSADTHFLVTELGGPNLDNLRSKVLCREFSVENALRLSYQALEAITSLHRANLLHLCVQPENFVVGLGSHACNLYIVGFSAVRKIDSTKKRSLIHAPHPIYASDNFGKNTNMIDDLMGWLYTTMDMLARTQLEWWGRKRSRRFSVKELDDLKAMKSKMFKDEQFGKLKNVPVEIQKIGILLQESQFIDFENYHDKIHMARKEDLRGLLRNHELDINGIFEWENPSHLKTAHLLTLGPRHSATHMDVYGFDKMSVAEKKEVKENREGVESSTEEQEREEKSLLNRLSNMKSKMAKLVKEALATQGICPDEDPSEGEE